MSAPELELAKSLSERSDKIVDDASMHSEKKGDDGDDQSGVLQGGGAAAEQQPWRSLAEAMSVNCNPATLDELRSRDTEEGRDAARGKGSGPKPPAGPLADPTAVAELALRAQLQIEKTRELVFGPEGLIKEASCFNWALGAGRLGFKEHSWPEACFDWVSASERMRHPRETSEGKPWKTVSVVAVQRRSALCLAQHPSVRPPHVATLDRVATEHCDRIAGILSDAKEEGKAAWDAAAPDLEQRTAEALLDLAARIAGLTPCPPSDTSVVLAMRGKPDVPPNFSHWWLELPTGRRYASGRPERIRCETYPGAPPYFTPGWDYDAHGGLHRGSFRIHVTGVLPEHLAVMAAALVDMDG